MVNQHSIGLDKLSINITMIYILNPSSNTLTFRGFEQLYQQRFIEIEDGCNHIRIAKIHYTNTNL